MSLLLIANMKLLLFLTAMTFAHAQPQQSDLNIIAVVSVPKAGREGPTQSWERGLEILPGAHLAVKHINDANLLGNYSLNLIEIITDGSDVNTALVEFIGHVTKPGQNIVGIVGPLCNEATLAIASLSLKEYEQFHLIQISPASAPIFQDTSKYPYLYRMLPSLNTYTETVLGLMKEVNWNKSAVLCSSNEDHYYCRAAESFVLSVSDRDLIELMFYGEVAPEEPSIIPTLEYLRESGAKIIVAFVPPVQASFLVTAAYNKGMKWPDYAWILPDYSVEEISNSTVTEGLLLLQPQLEAGDDNFHIISNITYSEYYNEYVELLASGPSLQSNPYANVFYDSVWALALALNKSRNSNNLYDQNIVTERISEEISQLSFAGTLGNVEFNGSHSRTNPSVDILHIRNREAQHVGHYNQFSGTVINMSLFNDIPSDELERHFILLTPVLSGIVSSIVASCILFITAMLFLYWYYRNEHEIKATSIRLSLFIFLGCYLMCISALMTMIAVFDGVRVPNSATAAYCCTRIWSSFIGGVLILSTLMVKLLRVYRVFTLFGKTGKTFSDAGLMVMILLVVSGMVIILTIWAAVDTYHIDEIETFNSKTTPPHYDIEKKCNSTYVRIWVSTLTAYIFSVFVPLLLLAFKTRMVWRSDFKDTKKVSAAVFTYAFLLSFCVPLWFLLESYVLQNVMLIVLYTAVPVVTQLFLFVPKVVPPLVRRFHAYSKF